MKKLTRSPDDKWLGGVCGGLADYTGLDATLVRLLVVVATVLGLGSLVVAYVVAWVIVPARPVTTWAAAADRPATAPGSAPPSA